MTDITEEQLIADESPGFKGADYNRVAKAAVLDDVRLLKLHTTVLPDAGLKNAVLSFGRELASCEFDDESGAAAAIFRFHVTAKAGRKTALLIKAEYMTVYTVGDVASANAARAFVKNVGLFAAYPYFRAMVAQIGWSAGLSLPPLPAIASTAYKSALAVPNAEE